MMILAFIFCGLLTGLIGGMLGIGGGVIIVPILYFVFQHANLFEGNLMQVVACTSLAVSLIISLFSAMLQHSKKAVFFRALKFLAPGLIIGSICGALLSCFIPSSMIKHIFGAIAILLGIYFMIPKSPYIQIASNPNYTLSFFGLLIGALSSLLGIGGGVLTFPTLLAYGVSAKNASATSSVTTALSCFIGTISFFIIALSSSESIGTFGYIDIRAFITIAIFAMITTPIGVKLSHNLKTWIIKQIFGICLCLVALKMILF